MKSAKEIILDKLNQLIKEDYRDGFESSVTQIIKYDLIDAGYTDIATKFWNEICIGYSYKNNDERNLFWTTLLNDKQASDIRELYDYAEEMARGEGCFVMPEWGTNGT